LFDKTFVFTAFGHRNRKGAYSYGDSAGFAPDFPFNPALAGTVCRCKYGRFGLRRKLFLVTATLKSSTGGLFSGLLLNKPF
jgi:hypothetical protein